MRGVVDASDRRAGPVAHRDRRPPAGYGRAAGPEPCGWAPDFHGDAAPSCARASRATGIARRPVRRVLRATRRRGASSSPRATTSCTRSTTTWRVVDRGASRACAAASGDVDARTHGGERWRRRATSSWRGTGSTGTSRRASTVAKAAASRWSTELAAAAATTPRRWSSLDCAVERGGTAASAAALTARSCATSRPGESLGRSQRRSRERAGRHERDRSAPADRARRLPVRRRRARERRRQPHQPPARADAGGTPSSSLTDVDRGASPAASRAPTSSSWRCASARAMLCRCTRGCGGCSARAPAGDRAHAQPRGARSGGAGAGRPACRCASTASTAAMSATSTGATPTLPARAPRSTARSCTRYVALSRDLARYLDRTGRRAARPHRADLQRRRHARASRRPRTAARRSRAARSPTPTLWLVGTVGRMEPVKDQANLARAFVRALRACGPARARGCGW